VDKVYITLLKTYSAHYTLLSDSATCYSRYDNTVWLALYWSTV